jgi:hypothetical protein
VDLLIYPLAVASAVMAVPSMAGVAAHQLVTTGALRSRRERKTNRDTRRAARRVAAAERAAVRSALAEIDADGRARLVVVPGRYRVSRRRLVPAVVAGLPVEPTGPDGVGDELAEEITAWLAGQPAAPAAPGPVEPQPDPSAEPTAGGVATLAPPPARKPARVRAPRARSMDQLRAEFRAALADPATVVDPGSAEPIRTTLRCSPARARQLRDEHTRSTTRTDRQAGDQR